MTSSLRLLSTGEAAVLLGVSPQTIRDLIRRGVLRPAMVLRSITRQRYFVSEADALALLTQPMLAPTRPAPPGAARRRSRLVALLMRTLTLAGLYGMQVIPVNDAEVLLWHSATGRFPTTPLTLPDALRYLERDAAAVAMPHSLAARAMAQGWRILSAADDGQVDALDPDGERRVMPVETLLRAVTAAMPDERSDAQPAPQRKPRRRR